MLTCPCIVVHLARLRVAVAETLLWRMYGFYEKLNVGRLSADAQSSQLVRFPWAGAVHGSRRSPSWCDSPRSVHVHCTDGGESACIGCAWSLSFSRLCGVE